MICGEVVIVDKRGRDNSYRHLEEPRSDRKRSRLDMTRAKEAGYRKPMQDRRSTSSCREGSSWSSLGV